MDMSNIYRNKVLHFFTIKSTDEQISKFILVRKSTYFGQKNCPKYVELRTKINLEIGVSVGFIVKKFVTMHGHINVKNGFTHIYVK
jgi:hypothetical protein